jgi:hypothetical protein
MSGSFRRRKARAEEVAEMAIVAVEVTGDAGYVVHEIEVVCIEQVGQPKRIAVAMRGCDIHRASHLGVLARDDQPEVVSAVRDLPDQVLIIVRAVERDFRELLCCFCHCFGPHLVAGGIRPG